MEMESTNNIEVMTTEDQQQQAQNTTLELDVGETIEGLDISESEGALNTTGNDVTDKELLRKIRKREKNKQNRRRKKTLMSNLSQVKSLNLQESVAAFATTVGARSAGMVNDTQNSNMFAEPQQPAATMNGNSLFGHVNVAAGSIISGSARAAAAAAAAASATAGTTATTTTIPAAGVPPLDKTQLETLVCVLDSANPNARLTHLDLVHVTEYLEKFIFTDLVHAAKLKIANTYLTNTKRLCIICHTPFSVHWVTKKIGEIPELNGRKYSAHQLKELDGMTKVSVLVPKECSMVHNFSDLIRFLSIQNTGFVGGTAVQAMNSAAMKNQAQDVSQQSDDLNKSVPEANSYGSTHETYVPSDYFGLPGDAATQNAKEEMLEKPDSSHPARARSYTFYADDTWLCELRRLNYRPYLGLRRLLCVAHERVLHSLQENVNKRKRRGTNFRRGKMGGRTDSTIATTTTAGAGAAAAPADATGFESNVEDNKDSEFQ